MSPTEIDGDGTLEWHSRPKRTRLESQRGTYGTNPNSKSLELKDVLNVLKEYRDDCDGGINCSICGKLYKSKVCFTKHIWEHSIYWDLFEGEKNHDRVLSIQAALILYSGQHGYGLDATNALSFLLVTSPHSHDKKKEKDGLGNEASIKSPQKRLSQPLKPRTPVKRKRSSGSLSSGSDSEFSPRKRNE